MNEVSQNPRSAEYPALREKAVPPSPPRSYQVRVELFRARSGKWYAGGLVEVPAVWSSCPDENFERIAAAQKFLRDEAFRSREMTTAVFIPEAYDSDPQCQLYPLLWPARQVLDPADAPRDGSPVLLRYENSGYNSRSAEYEPIGTVWAACRWIDGAWENWCGNYRTRSTGRHPESRVTGWMPVPRDDRNARPENQP